ncbi:MAG: UvrB/UvrC motif-containing protein [Planctomycetaceae bacterium]|nr:UvrB/UvrC motif-containing protein [Planctomycetaceae bacterium]
MRKCSRCSKPATLHITELKEGDVHALHLCEKCAQDYLSNVDVGQAPEEPEDLFQQHLENSIEDLEDVDQSICPSCGITFKEFRSQGRLGCPQCYLAFEKELIPLLENIHGETQHTGKLPKRAPEASRKQYDLIKLRNRLRTAVESESYEEAAQLRDEIQKMEAACEDPDD